ARKTRRGRWLAKNSSTEDCTRRSSCSCVRVMMDRCPCARRARSMADPTRPRWPATNTSSSFMVAKDLVAVARGPLVALSQSTVLRHHLSYQLSEGDLGSPAESGACPRGVADKIVRFGRAKVARIHPDNHSAVRIDACLISASATPFEPHADAGRG